MSTHLPTRLGLFTFLAAVVGSTLSIGSGFLRAQDVPKKEHKDRIVGTWELLRSPMPLPDGYKLLVKFGQANKLEITTITRSGRTVTVEGSYTIKGDELTFQTTGNTKDNKKTTIRSLRGNKLVTSTPGKGPPTEYKRVRP